MTAQDGRGRHPRPWRSQRFGARHGGVYAACSAARVGFEKLGHKTERSAKSLMRMFGPSGNPQARNLFEIIGYLQKHEDGLEVRAVR